jgi:hypothetical protein
LRAEAPRERWQWPLAAISLVAACSLQDFEYLQVPADVPAEGGSGGGGTNSGGDAGSSGTGGQGGNQATGGRAGTGNTAGEAGEGSATGGTSGSGTGGSGGTAGEGGMAGGDTGGTGATGATGELVNPSFETFSTVGWTIDPPSAATKRYIFVQAPTGTVPAPDGTYELATWHQTDGFQVEIYQNVTGLEDGTYTFQGSFSRGEGLNEIYMFARNCGGAEPDPMPIPVTSPSAFEVIALTGIEVSGGSCEVGVYVDSNLGNWMNADKFSLEPE